MDMDIIIYAVVAGILLFRLWSILGRRDGDDLRRDDRPNPFVAPVPPIKKEADTPLLAKPEKDVPSTPTKGVFILPPASLAGGLEQIHTLDSTFDEKKFLQGARLAFAMIIENFASDNMAAIERLIGPEVLPHFQEAVAERQAAAQKMETKILRITDCEVTAARVEGTRAIITIRFVSQQENILRDSEDRIIGGALGKIEEVTDLWTFARDSKSTDPNWILVNTHG